MYADPCSFLFHAINIILDWQVVTGRSIGTVSRAELTGPFPAGVRPIVSACYICTCFLMCSILPLACSAVASAAGASSGNAFCESSGKRKRGNKPKYVYGTQEEVVAHRHALRLYQTCMIVNSHRAALLF